MTSTLLLRGLSSVSSAVSSSASPSASPSPADLVRTPDPDLVTPGTIGFLVTFGVAVALVLLVRDMVRRNRGLVVRAERRDAEQRAAQEAEGLDRPPSGPDGWADDRRGPAPPAG